jgi:hypothetical protein
MNTDHTIRRTSYTKRADETLAEAVVLALARATGRSVNDFSPLYRTVDPDALGNLFGDRFDGSSREHGRISFVHDGYRIRIVGDDVSVRQVDD